MDVCEAYDIRHSEFLRWDADDRDKAIWHEIHKRQRCPSCGTRPDEWDPEKGGRPDAYRAVVHRCPGCAALEAKREDMEKNPEAYPSRGASAHLRRREG
ncbi:MAG TPA: hypothetical protein VIP28_15210 [Nocardioides sp.]